jgi:hypothetical protein
MTLGTIVYLCWYDFQKQTEHVCKGEVVDNSLWTGKQQADMINVRFQAPGMTAPICHHFAADRLSMTDSDVPHDECYLVCGKKTRFFEHDASARLKNDRKLNASEAWQQVQQFKRDRWDYKLGHLDIDALDEFYQLWRDAIAAKCGYTPSDVPMVHLTEEAFFPATSVPATTPAVFLQETNSQRRQKRSTGAIQYTDSIQTSIFD